jgi:hypothetical protein
MDQPARSAQSIEQVLYASELRQHGLEQLLGQLHEALSRDTLGGAPGDTWVPFNVALIAHKQAWLREAVMPDEIKARWEGRPFGPSTYAQELHAPLGHAFARDARPNPHRIERLIQVERAFRDELQIQRWSAGLVDEQQLEALLQASDPPSANEPPKAPSPSEPPKAPSAKAQPKSHAQPAEKPKSQAQPKPPVQAKILDVKLSGHLAYVQVQSLTDEGISYEVVCQRANKGWPPLYAGLRCTCPHWQTRLAQNLPPNVLPLRCKHFKFAERAARAAQEAARAQQEADDRAQAHQEADELYRTVTQSLIRSGKYNPAKIERVAQSLRDRLVAKIEGFMMTLHAHTTPSPT